MAHDVEFFVVVAIDTLDSFDKFFSLWILGYFLKCHSTDGSI
jgi:hypothetical protein